MLLNNILQFSKSYFSYYCSGGAWSIFLLQRSGEKNPQEKLTLHSKYTGRVPGNLYFVLTLRRPVKFSSVLSVWKEFHITWANEDSPFISSKVYDNWEFLSLITRGKFYSTVNYYTRKTYRIMEEEKALENMTWKYFTGSKVRRQNKKSPHMYYFITITLFLAARCVVLEHSGLLILDNFNLQYVIVIYDYFFPSD